MNMRPKGAPNRIFRVLGVVILLSIINQTAGPTSAQAQGSLWATPQTIPGYDAKTWPPILVADQAGIVHAFTYQRLNQQDPQSYRAIFYNRWSLERGWTSPNDIILSPKKDARLTDAYLDGSGIFHVLFWGGDETGAEIYYSKAPAAEVDDARAWSVPAIIGVDAGQPEEAVFVENERGILYVLYNGREQGNGLYIIHSDDRGESWSDATPLFLSESDEPNLSQLHLAKGRTGWIHAIWGVYNEDGQGRGIYYSKSKDGEQWSEPFLLADAADGLGTGTPAIIEYDDKVVVLYNLFIKIFMRRSLDNGGIWDDPALVFPRHVGVNGSLSMVIDGSNNLHVFFGQRISGNPDIHGMWHSQYISGRWLEPEAVIKGPAIGDLADNKNFDPFQARAVVSQGKTLLVTWRTDPGLSDNGVWYSYKALDAPTQHSTPLPSSIKPGSEQSPIVNTPNGATLPPESFRAVIPENDPTLDLPVARVPLQNDPSFVLLVGLVSAIILLLILVISRGSDRRK